MPISDWTREGPASRSSAEFYRLIEAALPAEDILLYDAAGRPIVKDSPERSAAEAELRRRFHELLDDWLDGLPADEPASAEQLAEHLAKASQSDPKHTLDIVDGKLSLPISFTVGQVKIKGHIPVYGLAAAVFGAWLVRKKIGDSAPAVQEKELTAQQCFERGFAAVNPDEQLRFYSEAIRLKPNYAEAFNNRGIALYRKGDLNGALKDYNEAIGLKPNYADAFNNRGIALYREGDLNGALKDYNEAIRLKPNYAEAFNNLGIARRDKGDLQGASDDFERARLLKATAV
jgi:tetratricopeptide (TPR) repeat protein